MKHLNVATLQNYSSNAPIGDLSFSLDSVQKNLLNQVPWPGYNYCPTVHFCVAHAPGCVFLKYYVNEKFIRAANGASNSAVCEDTCVEFFIAFDEEQTYYNFEFNCIGTMLVGYGKTKTGRELLSDQLIRQIKYQSVINNALQNDIVQWELTIAIPCTVFCHHTLHFLEGKKCRANFYKCGDKLPVPHYITWSNIKSPHPDFHLPAFFGALNFV